MVLLVFNNSRRCSPHFPWKRSCRLWLSGCPQPSLGPRRHAVPPESCWHWPWHGVSLPKVEQTEPGGRLSRNGTRDSCAEEGEVRMFVCSDSGVGSWLVSGSEPFVVEDVESYFHPRKRQPIVVSEILIKKAYSDTFGRILQLWHEYFPCLLCSLLQFGNPTGYM